MNALHNAHTGLARSILSSPPARVLALGFILLLMMGLNTDVMTSYPVFNKQQKTSFLIS